MQNNAVPVHKNDVKFFKLNSIELTTYNYGLGGRVESEQTVIMPAGGAQIAD